MLTLPGVDRKKKRRKPNLKRIRRKTPRIQIPRQIKLMISMEKRTAQKKNLIQNPQCRIRKRKRKQLK